MTNLGSLHAWQAVAAPWSPPNLEYYQSDEVRIFPIRAMRTQHVDILKTQRTRVRAQEVVDLAIVVQQSKLLLGNFFPREIMYLHLQLRRETIHAGRF